MNKFVREFVLVVLLCGVSADALHAASGELQKSLAQIDLQRNGTDTDTERLEKECLKLLDAYPSRADHGAVYAEIAMIYAQNGLTEPDKTIAYCRQALAFPIDVSTAGQMYVFWASALEVASRGLSREEFGPARKEIAVVCLRGLKLILEHGVPDTRQPLPAVNRFNHDGLMDDGVRSQLVKEHESEVLARKRAMLLNNLVHHRDALVDKIAYLYSRDPLAMRLLRALALEIVGDDRLRDDLVKRIGERIEHVRGQGSPESE